MYTERFTVNPHFTTCIKIKIDQIRKDVEEVNAHYSAGGRAIITFDSGGALCLLVELAGGFAAFGCRDVYGFKYTEQIGKTYLLNGLGNDGVIQFCDTLEVYGGIDIELTDDEKNIISVNGMKSSFFHIGENKNFKLFFESTIDAAFTFPSKPYKNSHYLYCNGNFARVKKGRGGVIGTDAEIIPADTPNGRRQVSFIFDGARIYKVNAKGARFELFTFDDKGRRFLRFGYGTGGIIHFLAIAYNSEVEKAVYKIFPGEARSTDYVPNHTAGALQLWNERYSKLNAKPEPEPELSIEMQEKKSVENYKKTTAKFKIKEGWGDIQHPEGFYVDGENVLFGLEDAKVHIDKKLNGGAGFFVTGNNGKKYLLEMYNNFWELQKDYENDPYNQNLFVKMKEGAKFDLYELYGGDIRDAFSCDLSRVFDAAGNSLDFSYKEEWEEFQIYGYRIDWGTARIVPTHQTDNGRALQVESEDGTASFVLEMDFELYFDFYVNFNLLECLERDYMYKEDIIRVIDAYPVDWNVTDPARRIMAESENKPATTNDKEQNEMQEKKEIETTEPTMEKPAAESIRNKEIQTSEPTPEPTAATTAESVQNPEPEKENRPPIVSKAAPDVSEIIELYKNFDDYKANDKLKKLFLKEQEKKGFLYFSEIVEICKAINSGAWNTFFYCHPMNFGATWSKSPEPGAQVIIGDSVYSCEDRLGYSDEERAKNCQICGNSRAQYKIHFWLEVMEPLKPSEKVEKVKDCWDKSRIGNPIVTTPADALNPEVKAMVKTINDYKRIVGSLFGANHNYNSVLSQIFHYYRDGEEITGKEPGGASRIDDYTIERVPNHNAIIVNFTLASKKPQPKPEPEKKQEELKSTPAPIEIKREPEPVKAAVASIPAPVVACKVDAPVQIPEPEPKPTTEEPDPEQIDKSKPTGAELRYSLSLLAMPYPIDTLIEKFLKKTNKPVRYSIVEKLLMTIDRGSVPKPGESKREYIKTYYQTH